MMADPKLPPWYSQEAYAADCEHWREVREGLIHSQPRQFSERNEDRVDACRFNAREHIEAAARWMRQAEELAKAAPNA